MYITQRITKKWCHFAKLIISLNVLLLNVTRRWTFNAVPAPHLLSLFLTRQPYPPWKSQIAHSGIHPFGINFQIHFVSLTSLVSIHLLIHLSTHLSSSPPSRHPSLLHSFTPGSKPTFSTNPSHLNFTSLPIGLPSWSWGWTGLTTLISLFLVFFIHFLFIPYSRLSWWSVSLLLHVKCAVSYRIVLNVSRRLTLNNNNNTTICKAP